MHRNRISKQITFLFLIITLLLQVTPVYAQGGNSITGQGTIENPTGGGSIAFSLTFNPAGGPVSGETAAINMPYTMGFGVEGFSTTTFVNYPACPITGNFAGGNGGAIQATVTCSGTFSQTINTPVGSGTVKGAMTWTATVNGTLNANGTGSGSADMTSSGTTEPFVMNGIQFPGSSSPASSYSTTWQVAYSAAEFSAAIVTPTAIPLSYFQSTYGVTVENGTKAWTPKELQLLDEVLMQIPSGLLNSMVLPKIVRDEWDFDDFGFPDESTFGYYRSSTPEIRIFDKATKAYDFQNDPDGHLQFKGTLIHELTHALVRSNGSQAYYLNAYANPLLSNYMSVGTASGANWQMTVNGNKWIYNGSADNQLPTGYAGTNPEEDLCESTMLYMMDPTRLKQSSIDRYTYIRDNIFGGIEYENGIQKKP